MKKVLIPQLSEPNFLGKNNHQLPKTDGLGVARLKCPRKEQHQLHQKNNTEGTLGRTPWNPSLYWPSSALCTPIPYFQRWWQGSKTPLGAWEHEARKNLILWRRTHVRTVVTSFQLWAQTSSHVFSTPGQRHRTGRSLGPRWPRTAVS